MCGHNCWSAGFSDPAEIQIVVGNKSADNERPKNDTLVKMDEVTTQCQHPITGTHHLATEKEDMSATVLYSSQNLSTVSSVQDRTIHLKEYLEQVFRMYFTGRLLVLLQRRHHRRPTIPFIALL